MRATSRSSYLRLFESGELTERAARAREILSNCVLCGRRCGVDRLKSETGFCRAGRIARIASWNDHHGEEPCVSGTNGSGTVFFSRCTLACLFCQNYPISQLGNGRDYTPEEFASILLALQRRGCHNINLVTPTHYVPQFLEALLLAAQDGLTIPIVYNTNGYDSPEALRLLDGVVDIYLPDLKYASPAAAEELSGRADYVDRARQAVAEMNRQVGRLVLDQEGIARRGLLVRHLVLPENLSGTDHVLAWLKEIDSEIHVALMSQYFPAHWAVSHSRIGRRITTAEYAAAEETADALGLENGYRQALD